MILGLVVVIEGVVVAGVVVTFAVVIDDVVWFNDENGVEIAVTTWSFSVLFDTASVKETDARLMSDSVDVSRFDGLILND